VVDLIAVFELLVLYDVGVNKRSDIRKVALDN
jgi:hypothetical protein